DGRFPVQCHPYWWAELAQNGDGIVRRAPINDGRECLHETDCADETGSDVAQLWVLPALIRRIRLTKRVSSFWPALRRTGIANSPSIHQFETVASFLPHFSNHCCRYSCERM